MAIPRIFQLLLLLISLFISAASSSRPSLSPSIATATHARPITLFAPTDASLPKLLQELSLPGLYPFHSLKNLPSPTILPTLTTNHCLTITTTSHSKNNRVDVFINGVELTRPDLFKNDFLIIHGLHGNSSHLSPLSCNVHKPMTQLSIPLCRPLISSQLPPSPPTPHAPMHLPLNDTINLLQNTGYYVVSLALRTNFADLSSLDSATIFAIDDTNSILLDQGKPYLSSFRYHVVPNMKLTSSDIANLPWNSSLPTMDGGNRLTVTVGGLSSSSSTVEINHAKITSTDLVNNSRIAVHGISTLFSRGRHHQEKENIINYAAAIQRSKMVHHDEHGTDMRSNRVDFFAALVAVFGYVMSEEGVGFLRRGLTVGLWIGMVAFAEAYDLHVVVVTGADAYGLLRHIANAVCFWCAFVGLHAVVEILAGLIEERLFQHVQN